MWRTVVGQFHDLLGNHASMGERVTASGNRLTVAFAKKYTLSKTFCERPEQAARLAQALSATAGGPISLDFATFDEPQTESKSVAPRGPVGIEKRREKEQQPFVRKALQMFDGRVLRVEEDS